MKKLLLSILILGSYSTYAQETTIQDALRYSVENLNGSARFRAMGGAFGAVGGDLSAININPAGSSIFNNNQASVSLTNYNTRNSSTYYGSNASVNDNSLDINQLGAVFVFKDQSGKSGWNKFTIGLNYDKVNNFNNYSVSNGTNPYNSMDQYFLQMSNFTGDIRNYYYDELGFTQQQTWLGYNSYVLEYDELNQNYYTNVPTGGNYYHVNQIETRGYNGKFTANASTSFKDILYLGMNLNFHFTDYTRQSSLTEYNNNLVYSDGFSATRAEFNNQLYTYGAGFSMNLGAIVKPTKDLRLGLSYETPTWYRLNDELSQYMITNVYDSTDGSTSTVTTNPNVVNIYEAYKVQSPGKINVSGAYVIGKRALISTDVIFKDYSSTKFKPTNDALLNNLNSIMKNQLQNTFELRVGGEYKIKKWSVRGGYRFEQSPYKVDYAFGDLFAYSGGLGYNFGISRLDLSYTNEHRNYNQYLLSSGLNDTARIRNHNNNVTLSYVINF